MRSRSTSRTWTRSAAARPSTHRSGEAEPPALTGGSRGDRDGLGTDRTLEHDLGGHPPAGDVHLADGRTTGSTVSVTSPDMGTTNVSRKVPAALNDRAATSTTPPGPVTETLAAELPNVLAVRDMLSLSPASAWVTRRETAPGTGTATVVAVPSRASARVSSTTAEARSVTVPVVVPVGSTTIRCTPEAAITNGSTNVPDVEAVTGAMTVAPVGPTTLTSAVTDDAAVRAERLTREPAVAVNVAAAFCPGVVVVRSTAVPSSGATAVGSAGTDQTRTVTPPSRAPAGSTTTRTSPVASRVRTSRNFPAVPKPTGATSVAPSGPSTDTLALDVLEPKVEADTSTAKRPPVCGNVTTGFCPGVVALASTAVPSVVACCAGPVGTSWARTVTAPVWAPAASTTSEYVPDAGSVTASRNTPALGRLTGASTTEPSGPTSRTVAAVGVASVAAERVNATVCPAVAATVATAFCPGTVVVTVAGEPPGTRPAVASAGTRNASTWTSPTAVPCGSTRTVYVPAAGTARASSQSAALPKPVAATRAVPSGRRMLTRAFEVELPKVEPVRRTASRSVVCRGRVSTATWSTTATRAVDATPEVQPGSRAASAPR